MTHQLEQGVDVRIVDVIEVCEVHNVVEHSPQLVLARELNINELDLNLRVLRHFQLLP